MSQMIIEPNSGAGVQLMPDEPHRGFLDQSRLNSFNSDVLTIYVTQYRSRLGRRRRLFFGVNRLASDPHHGKRPLERISLEARGRGQNTHNLVGRILWLLGDPFPLSWIDQICQNEWHHAGLWNANNITSKCVSANNACVKQCAWTNRTRTVRSTTLSWYSDAMSTGRHGNHARLLYPRTGRPNDPRKTLKLMCK